MSQINIQTIAQADDVAGAIQYLELAGSPNHKHGNGDGEEPLSAAWVAAYYGARNVMALFVRKGADLNFKANCVTVRELGINNVESLLGMIEGGMKPNGYELAKIFLHPVPHRLPTSADLDIAGTLIQRDSRILDEKTKKEVRALLKTPEIREAFPGLDTVRSVEVRSSAQGRELLKSVEESAVEAYIAFSHVIARAVAMLVTYGEEIDATLLRHFAGFRKNRKWLSEAATRARDSICESLAPKYDLFEDDDDLMNIVDLLIARYPIEERVKGVPDKALPPAPAGVDFERSIALQLKEAGFAIEETGGSGDQGADVIAKKDGLSFAVQCKDYGNPVGNAAVQQALSAKAYHGTDYAVVCAPNGFTKSAKSLGSTAGVILIPPTLVPQLFNLRALVE